MGRVLETLDETKFSQNTVVIFTSDHGDMLGDHGLSTKGAFMYDACTRVPMIIRHPEQVGSYIEDAPCQLHDIAATVLDLGQCQQIKRMPDSCNLLNSKSLQQRGYAVSMHRNSSVGHGAYYNHQLHLSMWREGNYKLNLYHSPEPEPTDSWGELFDLKNDPGEMTNLWCDTNMRNTRDELTYKLSAFLVRQDAQGRSRGEPALPPGFNKSGLLK